MKERNRIIRNTIPGLILYEMLCAIWYHIRCFARFGTICIICRSFATLQKMTLLHFFLGFLNCANGTKSRKASHIVLDVCGSPGYVCTKWKGGGLTSRLLI